MKKLHKHSTAYRMQYVTSDRFLVAALISNGLSPEVIAKTKAGVMFYTFKRSQRFTRLLERYENNTLKVKTDYYDRVCEMHYEPFDWGND